MGCDNKLLTIIIVIILVCVASGVYGYFEVSKHWPNEEPPKYPYLHWYFYNHFEMPNDEQRLTWFMEYGEESLQGLRWQLVGFMNGLALMTIIFYSYVLKAYVGLGKCMSFFLAFLAGALMAGSYTIYYLDVQSFLDYLGGEADAELFNVNISCGLAIASDVYNCLLFLFMIFGCICGCCRKEPEAEPGSYDYGNKGHLAI